VAFIDFSRGPARVWSVPVLAGRGVCRKISTGLHLVPAGQKSLFLARGVSNWRRRRLGCC
jgi:hypothetical protein